MGFLEQAGSFLEGIDAMYFKQWTGESNKLLKAGAHRLIVDSIPAKDGDIHVDLGCSYGIVLSGLQRKNPKMALLGVERSKNVVETAIRQLRACGYTAEQYGKNRLHEQGSAVHTEFYEDPEVLARSDMLEPNGPIRFIIDEIRRMSVLKAIIGSRKIQSGSFTFPGFSARVAYEAPFKPEFTNANEEDRRIMSVADETRRSAHAFFAQTVEAGGILVVAERVNLIDMDTSGGIPIDRKFIEWLLAGHSQYWDFVEGKSVLVREYDPVSGNDTRCISSDPMVREELAQGKVRPCRALVCKLQRNCLIATD